MPEEFEKLFARFTTTWPVMETPEYPWGLTLEEKEKEVVVRAELPGFEPEEVKVEVAGELLTVEAEHKEPAEEKEEKKEKKGPPPQVGTVIPPFVRDKLKLTNDQERQLATLEINMQGKLAKILTEAQMKKFEEALQEGPPKGGKEKKGPPQGKDGPPPMPGLLIPPFVEGKLQLTPSSKRKSPSSTMRLGPVWRRSSPPPRKSSSTSS